MDSPRTRWIPWIEKTETMMDAVDREDRDDGWMPWIEKTEDTIDGCRG